MKTRLRPLNLSTQISNYKRDLMDGDGGKPQGSFAIQGQNVGAQSSARGMFLFLNGQGDGKGVGKGFTT